MLVSFLSWGVNDAAVQTGYANLGNFIATNAWLNLVLGLLFIFFAFSREEGTYAYSLGDQVDKALTNERLLELSELQDSIASAKRDETIGENIDVLVDEVGIARSFREAPEIDGIIKVSSHLPVGEFANVKIVEAIGTDVIAI